jgi:hypothetical protein
MNDIEFIPKKNKIIDFDESRIRIYFKVLNILYFIFQFFFLLINYYYF